jgi:primase-polymerase (primpol)-like protein
MTVEPLNIPAELKALSQWVLWLAEPRNGRVSKVPCRADGRRASSTNPDGWTSFDEALNTCQARGYSGVGLVFREGGGIVGVDLDHVIDDAGNVEPWAARVVRAFNSYTEISVSGHGLHIICRGSIPDGKGHRRGQAEMYDRGRYFTVTGRAYGELRPLREAQAEIDRLLEWITREEPKPQPQKSTPRVSSCFDDRKLLHHAASAKNGYKFARLWRGDISDYGGDESRADVALLSLLLFWTDGNEARADALFRQSGLCRDKWLNREDYRARCFGFCMRGRTA